MGKIILTVEGTTVGTVAEGRGIVIESEVSEQDSGRLIAAFARLYRNNWKDADGNLRQPSIKEVLQAWWDNSVIAASTAVVMNEERAAAAQAASDAVTPIAVSKSP